MLLRARTVAPIAGPAIDNGAVAVEGNRISWMGRSSDAPSVASSEVLDLGDVILLPGLINAHCHLDYTGLAGTIPPPKGFTDWIKSLVSLKATWTTDDYLQSWRAGAQMLLSTGTTSVADIEAVPALLPEVWSSTPLRVTSFREVIHLKRDTGGEVAERAAAALDAIPASRGRVGLSPHAPYTTTTELLQSAANAARARGWRLTTHVAESKEEFQMFSETKGALYDWLAPQRDVTDCGGVTPVQHLQRAGYLGSDLLAAHVNYLGPGDAAALGSAGAHVVHCPRSHAYFGHATFPFDVMTAHGVNVCLGTDSLVTVRPQPAGMRLDLFAEMRSFSRRFPDVAPEVIVKMVTVNAAAALGKSGIIGELGAGALADFIVLPYHGNTTDLYDAVVQYDGAVPASMIDGQWIFSLAGA
jgi:cytosine/adenosine deaminase-related metal-dependent hydrolase